jgi:WD40 repeat protein
MKQILLCFLAIFLFGLSSSAQEMGLKENKEFADLGSNVLQAEFSPFRNYFVYTLVNNTLRIYGKNWEKLLDYQGDPNAAAGVFAFTPDEKYMAYGKYKGKKDIAIIRLSDQKVIQIIEQHTDYINELRFSHDGNYLVSCSSDKSLIIWRRNVDSFVFQQILKGFDSSVDRVSFSPDDRYLVSGSSYGTVKILKKDGLMYENFQEFQFRKHSVSSLAYHPENDEFITGSSYGLRRYKLKKNHFVLTDSLAKDASSGYIMNYSPGGRYLASRDYQDVRIFHVGEYNLVQADAIFRHSGTVLGCTFSEDGKFLCTFGTDQRIIIWEIDNIQPSDKALVSSWLIGGLSVAQRRSLTPGVTRKIISSTSEVMTASRDEFEKTVDYNIRLEKLSDHTLKILQEEMENLYDISSSGNTVKIPVQSLVGYNADREIYKIRMMESEAGVQIPVSEAKKLKGSWQKAFVKAKKVQGKNKASSLYEDFYLVIPGSSKEFPVVPIENPFHQVDKSKANKRDIKTTSQPSQVIADTVNGTTYAILFATNIYDYFGDLVNPMLDAQTIAAELEESYGVVAEVVLNPTLEETSGKLREYASMMYGTKDNLMVFFAGHGIYDEVFREGYVISRDSKMEDLGKSSYLSHSILRTMINNIRCPHIFLVMDVCFGGTFDPHLATASHRGATMYSEISAEEFVQRKLKYNTRLYLTSGGKEYVPDGRPGFHSPFARQFIRSLREYGGEDGVLTTAEILQFVEKVIPEPRFGEFGDNEPGSDFILVLKQ